MLKKVLSVGDFIDSKCTKCREVMNHTIVAMVEDKVVRVECNTCRGTHNYRPPAAPKKAAPVKKAAARRPTKAVKALEEMEELSGLQAAVEAGARQTRPYDMGSKFRVDDLVQHPTFGVGLVKSTTRPNKMEALFSDGLKRLRCAL